MRNFILVFCVLVFCRKSLGTSCVPENADEFWPSVRLPRTIANGKVAGECMDTKLARASRIVNASRIPKGSARHGKDLIYVANFRHLDRYWIAEIPVDGVEQILIQEEVDSNGSGFHNETRFLMFENQPVRYFLDDESLFGVVFDANPPRKARAG